MAKRTASEIYADLRTAGFTAASAVLMTAISLAESGGDDTSLGDVSLQNSTWGPSYGLFQIRTLKDQTGTGGDRDISALAGNDARQALSALHISGGGQDFTPWSVYTSGKYQQYLGQAQQAAGMSATDVSTTTTPAGTVSDTLTAFVAHSSGVMLTALFMGLGLAMIVGGAVLAVRPTARRINAGTQQARRAVTTVIT